MNLNHNALITYQLRLLTRIFLSFSLVILAACHSGLPDKSPMKIIEKEVIKVDNQHRHYLIVTGFDENSKACWQSLESFAESTKAPAELLAGNHLLIFVDTADFPISKDGEFTDSQAQHVIAQHLLNKQEGDNTFLVSPTYLIKRMLKQKHQ
jgi:hypothetical protein